ncbi:hypothetical protein Srufu_079890 (plasmid) [Streptomyces libani subsp. rufus]|nr:hypothetical protein Srufu_079890 [Streptomyces libani subsp. rufus]
MSAWQQYLGRIVSRGPVTETSTTVYGQMALLTGSTITWEAPSSLVEIHVETFNCPQIVAAGYIAPNGALRIRSVRPVLAEEWAEGIAALIAERYDLPSNDPHTEKVRKAQIQRLVLSMAVPVGLSPAEARRRSTQRAMKAAAQAAKAVAA